MFETSQQESGSGSSKIIGGAVAVVGVLMVGFYFLFMQGGEPAGTPGEGQAGMATSSAPVEDEGPPDPMRDLVIQRFSLDRDRTQTMAMWTIQLANRSRQHGYKDIQYETNYYDSNETLIYQNSEGIIAEQLDPGDQRTISEINDGLYPVGAVRYTVELKGATPVAGEE
jgi:hypothetical protein